jgi:hypothetical protein
LNPRAFKVLLTLCEAVYSDDHNVPFPAEEVHGMLLSHSEFLNVMMEQSSEVKG